MQQHKPPHITDVSSYMFHFDYLKKGLGSNAESEIFVVSRDWFEYLKNLTKLRKTQIAKRT